MDTQETGAATGLFGLSLDTLKGLTDAKNRVQCSLKQRHTATTHPQRNHHVPHPPQRFRHRYRRC